jgi:hypothetical protein
MQAKVKDLLENPHIAKLYAKSNCKKCFGRGTQTFQKPDKDIYGNRIFLDKLQLCTCILNTLKKEKDSGKDAKRTEA